MSVLTVLLFVALATLFLIWAVGLRLKTSGRIVLLGSAITAFGCIFLGVAFIFGGQRDGAYIVVAGLAAIVIGYFLQKIAEGLAYSEEE